MFSEGANRVDPEDRALRKAVADDQAFASVAGTPSIR